MTRMKVMTALPTITSGFRARSDRRGGGGTCSGSSAARGLRGEMGGRSLIDDPVALNRGVASLRKAKTYAQLNESSPNAAKRWTYTEQHQLITRWMITDA